MQLSKRLEPAEIDNFIAEGLARQGLSLVKLINESRASIVIVEPCPDQTWTTTPPKKPGWYGVVEVGCDEQSAQVLYCDGSRFRYANEWCDSQHFAIFTRKCLQPWDC